MTDWELIERHLDDHSTTHGCAFCGGAILPDDGSRWSLAVRRPKDRMSVLWVHPGCLVDRLHFSARAPYEIDLPPR
jgi:hypothetical protein